MLPAKACAVLSSVGSEIRQGLMQTQRTKGTTAVIGLCRIAAIPEDEREIERIWCEEAPVNLFHAGEAERVEDSLISRRRKALP